MIWIWYHEVVWSVLWLLLLRRAIRFFLFLLFNIFYNGISAFILINNLLFYSNLMNCCETEKDKHTTVYPYLQGSGKLSEKPSFSDNDLMGSVSGDMLPVFCLKYKMIIIMTFLISGFWSCIWISTFYEIGFI